jgi:Helix-turn-helix domain
MSNAPTRKSDRKSDPNMPKVDWDPAKRIVRRLKGKERLPLRAVRTAVGMTQAQVASAAEMEQGDVSRLEARDDAKISTLSRYARALGGTLEIAVIVGGRRYLIEQPG